MGSVPFEQAQHVLFANEAFYAAFAGGDIEAMEALWSRERSVSCVHPGWEPLLDRSGIVESWRAILSVAPDIQCHDPVAHEQAPGAAMVICYEAVGGGFLLASNCFALEDGQWLMTHHHAGPTRGKPRLVPKRPQPDQVN